MQTTPIIKTLTYMGALPFYLALLLYLTDQIFLGVESVNWFLSYGLVILSFMAGTLWGQVIRSDDKGSCTTMAIVVISNFITLVAWVIFLLAQLSTAIVLITLGFIALYVAEVFLLKSNKQPSYYLSLRLKVTSLVVLAHAIMYLLI